MLKYANRPSLYVHITFLINFCILGKIQEAKSAECLYIIYSLKASFVKYILEIQISARVKKVHVYV